MMPKIVSKPHSPHVVETRPTQHRRKKKKKKKKKNPTESIGMVLAKYPPKIKSENFHNSRVSELG